MGSGKQSSCFGARLPQLKGPDCPRPRVGEPAPSAWAMNTGTPRPWFGSTPSEQGRDRDRLRAGVVSAFRSQAALPHPGPARSAPEQVQSARR